MSITVKCRKVKKRTYNSNRRQAQAASTRRDIIEAARRLFERGGYNATTMTAIAEKAGVVVETIYRNFDSKAGLIEAVVEAAVAGGAERAEVAPEDRPAIRRLIEERDPRKKLALYAATQPGIHERAGKLRKALREGARVDPQLVPVLERLEAQPFNGMARFARHLKEVGALRTDLPVEEARDLLWSINSLSMYELLVGERGWSAERYQDWLTSMMTQSLLPR
ncbi:MAG: TetR/AcrR family transcriptional regulator [Acidimicrobiia bacterium]